MKKLLVALMLVMASTGARAEWTKVSEKNGETNYFDFGTIVREGNNVRLWILSNSSGGSTRSLREYDCDKEEARVHVVYAFLSNETGQGKPDHVDDNPSVWMPVSSNSAGYRVMKLACKR